MGYRAARWVIAAVCASAASLAAQAPDVGYYQHDYARTPLAEQREERRLPRGQIVAPTPTPEEEVVQVVPAVEERPVDETPSPTPSAEATPAEERGGLPISEVRVFVNAMERSHLLDVVAEYGSLATKYDLTSSGLISVGGFFKRDEIPPELTRLLLLGTPIAPFGLVPPKYKVERSPTWVLVTAEGEIVLEGFMSIDKFLNRKGEFQRRFLELDDRGDADADRAPVPAPLNEAVQAVKAAAKGAEAVPGKAALKLGPKAS